MTTFITQARFTQEGLKGMIAAPEDRAEVVGRLIAAVGGKLSAYYLTSGDYDILLIFEAPSYEDVVPALIVAAAGSGVTDLKTVTALKSSEMKNTFAKAGSIAMSYRAPGERLHCTRNHVLSMALKSAAKKRKQRWKHPQ